jgi:hypothetical protein
MDERPMKRHVAPYYVVMPEWAIGPEEYRRQIAMVEQVERQRRASSIALFAIGLTIVCLEIFGLWGHFQWEMMQDRCAAVRAPSGANSR